MLEVITGLENITKYLTKELPVCSDSRSLEDQSVSEFILKLSDSTDQNDLFHEIGIETASPSHLACLATLPLKYTYNVLRLFYNWVKDGFYDFCSIPFVFKVHMSSQEQKDLEEKWSGTTSDLMEKLEQIRDILKHSEVDITNRTNDASSVSFTQICYVSMYFIIYWNIFIEGYTYNVSLIILACLHWHTKYPFLSLKIWLYYCNGVIFIRTA